ncbi:MAG: type II secretion system F family protein [Mariprofundaceae bacterium]|nr:type II secretion system F family protein [Mariprofundaceae bacterium]
MRHFHYAAKRENGLGVQGWLVAEDRADAIEILRHRQMQPLYVRPGPGKIPIKVPVEELLASLRELASLRGSGMALDMAIDAVGKTSENRDLRHAWKQVSQSVRSGLSLSDAFASLPMIFPRYAIPMIRQGEENGQLQSVLQAVADRLEEELSLHNEIRSALTYPAFLLLISVAVLLFLFLVVIPKFGIMVGDMGGDSSGSLQTLVMVAALMRDYFWLWGGAAVFAIAGLIRSSRNGNLQEKLWLLFQYLPAIRKLFEAWEIVQFCGSMQRLLPQGVPILEALELSYDALDRESIRQRLKLVAGNMRQGGSLAEGLTQQKVFPPLVLQMISVGETSSGLPDSMFEIRKLYERRLREGIRRALALLEPAVIVTLGVLVGGIMVTLLSGIMSMNDLPI